MQYVKIVKMTDGAYQQSRRYLSFSFLGNTRISDQHANSWLMIIGCPSRFFSYLAATNQIRSNALRIADRQIVVIYVALNHAIFDLETLL